MCSIVIVLSAHLDEASMVINLSGTCVFIVMVTAFDIVHLLAANAEEHGLRYNPIDMEVETP